jgi:hypothetical protein
MTEGDLHPITCSSVKNHSFRKVDLHDSKRMGEVDVLLISSHPDAWEHLTKGQSPRHGGL